MAQRASCHKHRTGLPGCVPCLLIISGIPARWSGGLEACPATLELPPASSRCFAKPGLGYLPCTARRSRTAASNGGMSRSTTAQTRPGSAPSYWWIRTLRRSFISRQGILGCAARKSEPTFREASPMISRFRQTALNRMETGTPPCSRRPKH